MACTSSGDRRELKGVLTCFFNTLHCQVKEKTKSSVNKELKQQRRRRERERQKEISLDQHWKQQLWWCVMLYSTFLCSRCTTMTWNFQWKTCTLAMFFLFFFYIQIKSFGIEHQKNSPTFDKLNDMADKRDEFGNTMDSICGDVFAPFVVVVV